MDPNEYQRLLAEEAIRRQQEEQQQRQTAPEPQPVEPPANAQPDSVSQPDLAQQEADLRHQAETAGQMAQGQSSDINAAQGLAILQQINPQQYATLQSELEQESQKASHLADLTSQQQRYEQRQQQQIDWYEKSIKGAESLIGQPGWNINRDELEKAKTELAEIKTDFEKNKGSFRDLVSKNLSPFVSVDIVKARRNVSGGYYEDEIPLLKVDIEGALKAGVNEKELKNIPGIRQIDIVKAKRNIRSEKTAIEVSIRSGELIRSAEKAERIETTKKIAEVNQLLYGNPALMAQISAQLQNAKSGNVAVIPDGKIDSKNIIYYQAIMNYPKTGDKQTSLIPNDAQFYKMAGFGVAETEEMKRYGKSFIPGWLTIEDWDKMKWYERAASIAGDVGSTILIVLGVGGAIKGVIANRPAAALKGTVPKNYPGLKIMTNADVKSIVKDLKIPEFQKTNIMKSTVPITEPVDMPVNIAIVEDGPAGVRFLQGTQKIQRPYITGREGGGSPPAPPPTLKPPTPGPSKSSYDLPVKGGGGSEQQPSTATMTVDQLLKELGINEYSVVQPQITPIVIPVKKKKGKVIVPVPQPTPFTTPETVPIPGESQPITPGKTDIPGKTKTPGKTTIPNPVITVPGTPTRTIATPTTGTSSGTEPVLETPTKTETSTPTELETVTQTETPTKTATVTETPNILKTPERPPVRTPVNTPFPPRVISPSSDEYQSNAREMVKNANGAVAWKMGKVGSKQRYDVIIHPYQSDEHYMMVLGKAPEGATVVKGTGSAYRSIKLLRGEAPERPVHVDTGIMDVHIEPRGKKAVGIRFSADPKQLTSGDITIGRPRVSDRIPALTARPSGISRRARRITPRTPRLR